MQPCTSNCSICRPGLNNDGITSNNGNFVSISTVVGLSRICTLSRSRLRIWSPGGGRREGGGGGRRDWSARGGDVPSGDGIKGEEEGGKTSSLIPFLLSRMNLLFVLFVTALLVHADPVSYSFIIYHSTHLLILLSAHRFLDHIIRNLIVFLNGQPANITRHFHKSLIRCLWNTFEISLEILMRIDWVHFWII